MENEFFSIGKKSSQCNARLGVLHLEHGDVETPVFMPVGTNGTVKGIYHKTLSEIGYKLILGNTYHLYLRPGEKVLEHFGGLHNFSAWRNNFLTDSGGFQAFSLSKLRKITPEGVTFQSHIDGSRHTFTPESVMRTQGIIGSDIAMVLDVCLPPGVNHKKAEWGLKTTHEWAERALEHIEKLKQNGERVPSSVFGIAQGNFFEDLRVESAKFISSLPFAGVAIGGLSVGESPEDFKKYLKIASNAATFLKPRYVMGIGNPEYIFEAVENGIDMFDCVLATRIARNGTVFTKNGLLNLKKSFNEFSKESLDDGCQCSACKSYSRGYLRHMFKANEMFGAMLATEHNLTFLYNLLADIRKSIKEDRFLEFKKQFFELYKTKN